MTLIISLIAGIITFATGFALGRNQRQKDLPRSRRPMQITSDQVEADNPHAREVIAQAFNSGNVVIGNVDDSGKLHTEEIVSDQHREG